MANGTADSITPFLSIWTEPRATIRRIVDTEPTRNVIALAAIGPAISALASQWAKAMGNNAGLSVLWPIWVAVTVAFEAGLGIVGLFIGAAVLKWSGGLLGGVASRVEVRAAMAWGQIPAIAAAIVLLISVLFAVPFPTAQAISANGLPHIQPGFYKVLTIEGVLGFWGFIVSLKCIGEVHRFSAWRALGASLIPAIVLMILLAVAFFLLHVLVGHH